MFSSNVRLGRLSIESDPYDILILAMGAYIDSFGVGDQLF